MISATDLSLIHQPSSNLEIVTKMLFNMAKNRGKREKDVLFGQSISKVAFILEGLDM